MVPLYRRRGADHAHCAVPIVVCPDDSPAELYEIGVCDYPIAPVSRFPRGVPPVDSWQPTLQTATRDQLSERGWRSTRQTVTSTPSPRPL